METNNSYNDSTTRCFHKCILRRVFDADCVSDRVIQLFVFSSCRESAEHTGTTTEEASQPSSSSQQHDSTEADEDREEPQPSTSKDGSQNEDGENEDKEGDKDEAVEAVLTEEDLIQQSQAEYDSGRYSPTLLTSSELPLDSHTTTLEEDMHRLQLARRQLQVTGTAGLVCWQTAKILRFLAENMKVHCNSGLLNNIIKGLQLSSILVIK